MKPARNAFTLVELLVALAIIAILSAIGFIAYSSVIKQGRDSKRISDLRTIQSALEQYYRDQGFYPTCLGAPPTPPGFCNVINSTSLSLTNATNNPWDDPPANPVPITKTYLHNLPVDPINSSEFSTPYYVYFYVKFSPSFYCLFANVENSSNSKIDSRCSNVAAPFNYKIAPP